jgi:kynurenine 3-monooxygenase
MTSNTAQIAIVGGGLAGSLLAIMLARRDIKPIVIERAAPLDVGPGGQGRSINLALAARGIKALRHAGVFAAVEPLLIPMTGRMLHENGGAQRYLAYGQHRDELIYSVARDTLNRTLYELARDELGVEYRFRHECTGLAGAPGSASIDSPGGSYVLDAELLVAADGAGSAVRRALQAAGAVSAREDMLDHGYKELALPAAADGGFALSPGALHIWPRGGFMLIALPNLDRSFTATLFLPMTGETSFAGSDLRGVGRLFTEYFPDAVPLIPELERQYRANPVGHLGTLTCRPWSHAGRVLLLGDAAHAIVPFHGQGMNAAFEDCLELDGLIAAHAPDWSRVCTQFEDNRAANAAAIAAMALENYREMRDDVRSASFKLKAELAFELERRHPGRFIPRYAMVMFHPEISYADARRRGAVQAELLDRLTRGARTLADVDFELAAALVDERL